MTQKIREAPLIQQGVPSDIKPSSDPAASSTQAPPITRPPSLPAKHPLVLAALLTGTAGFLDAAAYIKLGHLYVSFMSGNSTHLGMAVAHWTTPELVALLGVVIAFVVGAAVGTRIADHAGPRLIVGVLATETGLLFLATLLSRAPHEEACVLLIAAAMGMQNVLHQSIGGVDVGNGFVSGMLFRLGQSLARLPDGTATLRVTISYLRGWLLFVVGAICGTLAFAPLGLTGCLAVVSSIILTMTLAAFIGKL